jgi:epoxyqueuosine reductase
MSNVPDKIEAAALIKKKALELGFSACGIASVSSLPEDAAMLRQWLANGYNGRMAYLANHFDKRTNPALMVENARSVIVVLLSYAVDEATQSGKYRIARYAKGDDYHLVVKQYLAELQRYIENEITPLTSVRIFCDSAPVLERRWAQRAGLGFIGTNRCLIHPDFGSFCFIGELIVDADLEPDFPHGGDCGNCGHCVKACPTGAIEPDGTLNASKCISYLTVELKDQVPAPYNSSLKGYVAGCDICQNVCPWNKNAAAFASTLWKQTRVPTDDAFWENMTPEDFDTHFRNSALYRTGYKKIKQNIDIVSGSAAGRR